MNSYAQKETMISIKFRGEIYKVDSEKYNQFIKDSDNLSKQTKRLEAKSDKLMNEATDINAQWDEFIKEESNHNSPTLKQQIKSYKRKVERSRDKLIAIQEKLKEFKVKSNSILQNFYSMIGINFISPKIS